MSRPPHSFAYSGDPFPRSLPATPSQTQRASTASRPSRAPSGPTWAPAAKIDRPHRNSTLTARRSTTPTNPTKRSTSPRKERHATRNSQLAPVSTDGRDDDRTLKSGWSKHGPVAAPGARLGDFTKRNIDTQGGSTRRKMEDVEGWTSRSLGSAKPVNGKYEVVRYRDEGLN